MSETILALGLCLASGLGAYIIKRFWDLKEKLTVMDSVPLKEWHQRA
jgi:hypothetical protein